MLCGQLRALIEAASGRELRIMFPMVSEVAEFDKARALVDREWALACARGVTLPKALHVGAMLEVPSLYFQLPALLERVDFSLSDRKIYCCSCLPATGAIHRSVNVTTRCPWRCCGCCEMSCVFAIMPASW